MTPRSVEQQTCAAGWVPAVEGAVDGQLIARRDGSFAVIEDWRRGHDHGTEDRAAEVCGP